MTLLKKIANNLAYHMGESREEYLNLEYLNAITKELIDEECRGHKDTIGTALVY